MNFIIAQNGSAEGFCIVKTADKKVTAKGMPYLDLILSDSDGEINGKIWDYDQNVWGEYNPGDIVKVRGVVSKYNNTDQIKIDRIRKANESDNINISDYVKSAEFDGERMYNEIVSIVDGFKNEDIKRLVLSILGDYKEKLLFWPAAFKLHHAIRGGLLYHSLSVLRLAQGVVKIYPFINSDLLFAGAILHDIAKTDEFEVTETGLASGYSKEGNLLGHLVKGAMIVNKYCEKLGVDEEVAVLLEHMLISHHGEPEFGASVRPMFIEAEVLSTLDTLDAKIYEMADAIDETEAEGFSNRLWALNDRRLYKHKFTSDTRKVDLL